MSGFFFLIFLVESFSRKNCYMLLALCFVMFREKNVKTFSWFFSSSRRTFVPLTSKKWEKLALWNGKDKWMRKETSKWSQYHHMMFGVSLTASLWDFMRWCAGSLIKELAGVNLRYTKASVLLLSLPGNGWCLTLWCHQIPTKQTQGNKSSLSMGNPRKTAETVRFASAIKSNMKLVGIWVAHNTEKLLCIIIV